MKKNFDMDDLFDKNARDAFKEFEMPFNPEDWKKMERKLDKKEHLLPHLWLYKGLEAIVLMLVLFTMFNLWMPTNTTTDNASSPNQHNTPHLTPAIINSDNTTKIIEDQAALPTTKFSDQSDQPLATNHSTLTTTRIEDKQSTVLQNTVIAPSKERKQNNNIVHHSAKRIRNSANPSHGNQPRGFYKSNSSPKASFNNNNDNIFVNQNTSSIATNSTKNELPSNSNTLDNQNNSSFTDNQTSDKTANDNEVLANTNTQLAPIELMDVDNKKHLPIGDEPAINLKKLTIKYPYMRQLRLGVVVGAEAHTNNSNGRGSGGYMLGVMVDAEFSSLFSINVGLTAAQRSYELEQVKTVDNTTTQDGLLHSVKETRKTHFTVVNIPVNAQFRLYKDKQWRVYVSTGVGASFILSKQYAGNQQTTLAQTSGGVRIATDINTNEYEGGALQNNDWKHNTFMTLQASVGVERQLGDKISLFVQPNFQQSLTKFGLNGDKTSIFSLNVGIKTTL